jgi:hypothetical protein
MRPWESVPAPSQRDGRWAETHHPATCSGFRRSGHDREFSRISALAGFVRQLGQQRVAQSGPIHVALLGIGLAGQRTVNRSGFNLWFGWSVRSWESVPATPQQGRDSGPTSARGRAHCGSSRPTNWLGSFAIQSREPPGFLRCDWVRFAVFFIDFGRPQLDKHSRPPILVRRRWQVGARRSPPRAKAHGRIPPRGVLHDNSHSPGERVLADRRHGPRAATRTGRLRV